MPLPFRAALTQSTPDTSTPFPLRVRPVPVCCCPRLDADECTRRRIPRRRCHSCARHSTSRSTLETTPMRILRGDSAYAQACLRVCICRRCNRHAFCSQRATCQQASRVKPVLYTHVLAADSSVSSQHCDAHLVAELLIATVACFPLLEMPLLLKLPLLKPPLLTAQPLNAFLVKHARGRKAHSVSQAVPALGAHKAAYVPRFAYLTSECDLPIITRGAKCQLAGAAHLRTTERTFEAVSRSLPSATRL